METRSELAAVEHGDVWLISGEDATVASVLDEIGVMKDGSGGILTASVAHRVSQACGLTAQLQAHSGRWVKLTEDSAARLRQLAATNKPKDGVLSGVVRGKHGRIDQHVRFSMPNRGMVNPLVLSNVATLAASFAAQAAAEELQDTLRGIEEKIDALAEDRRTELVGATRGVTQVVAEAFTLYQRTGELGSASWDKVQSLQPDVLSTWHRGLERIRSEASRAAEARLTDRDDILDTLANQLLPLWLPVLGQCLVTLSRFRVLEQARVESVEPHLAEQHRALVVERNHQLLDELQTILGEVLTHAATAIDVPDRLRVAHPVQVSRLHAAANNVQTQIRDFGSQVNWFDDQLASWENKGWAASIRDLARTSNELAKGVAARSFETARKIQLPRQSLKGITNLGPKALGRGKSRKDDAGRTDLET
ncbi:hypothetical protein ACFFIO_07885 [Citricoccus parietis]|uniref:Uncharacterized protein n=1 Tax=Citricoccus parietis TaxID=592307 RepID=A0ABV6F4I1_9MICC